MTTEILTVCIAARPGVNGELNLLGSTDIIAVPNLPIGISCSIVAKIRFQKSEDGEKEVKLSIIDADGRVVQKPPPPQRINIQTHSGASSTSALFVFGIQNLQIPKAGEYEVGLVVNQRQEMSIPIFVRQIAPRLPSMQQPPQISA